MRCINCRISLDRYSSSGICYPCRSDANVMITTTNAKKKYMLTNQEINSADLYSCEISYKHAHGFKYLVKDIEMLAEEVFMDVDFNDKRKQKYLKNIEEDNAKIILINEMKESILAYFEEHEMDVDDDTEAFIESLVRYKYTCDVADVIGIIKRKIKINSMLNMCDDEPEFIERAKEHDEVDLYVYEHHTSLHETFATIKTDIGNEMIMGARCDEMKAFLRSNIDHCYVDHIKSLSIYRSYTTQISFETDFKVVCKKLSDVVKRCQRLNKFVDEKLSNCARSFLISLPVYKKYITDLPSTTDFKTVRKNLIEHAKRKAVIDKLLVRLNPCDRSTAKSSCEYDTYIRNLRIKRGSETVFENIIADIEEKNKAAAKSKVAKKKKKVATKHVIPPKLRKVTSPNFPDDRDARTDEIYEKCVERNGGEILLYVSVRDRTKNIDATFKRLNVDDNGDYEDIKYDYLLRKIALDQLERSIKDKL